MQCRIICRVFNWDSSIKNGRESSGRSRSKRSEVRSEREKFAKLTLSKNDPELDESAKVMTRFTARFDKESIFSLTRDPDMDKVTPISLSAKPKDSTHRHSGAVREKTSHSQDAIARIEVNEDAAQKQFH